MTQKLDVEEVIVTPKMATEMLERNSDNRKISWTHVTFLAKAMKRGEWKMTHQAIAISPSGRLLDGQHRLWAIIESEISVPMLVARNVSEDVYDCLDIGKKRSISDILGGDKRVVDTCTYLARLSTGQQTVTPQLVQPFVTAFSEMTEELLRSSQVRSKGLGATAIRAPVVIHMFRSDKHYNHCLTQYPAMLSRNYSFMAKSVQALVRQVDGSTRTNIGHIWEQSARAWIAFDVFRSDLERIQVKNHMYSVEEMRAVISSRMREKQKEFIAA